MADNTEEQRKKEAREFINNLPRIYVIKNGSRHFVLRASNVELNGPLPINMFKLREDGNLEIVDQLNFLFPLTMKWMPYATMENADSDNYYDLNDKIDAIEAMIEKLPKERQYRKRWIERYAPFANVD